MSECNIAIIISCVWKDPVLHSLINYTVKMVIRSFSHCSVLGVTIYSISKSVL